MSHWTLAELTHFRRIFPYNFMHNSIIIMTVYVKISSSVDKILPSSINTFANCLEILLEVTLGSGPQRRMRPFMGHGEIFGGWWVGFLGASPRKF